MYIHLDVHSEYNFDSLIQIPPLLQQCEQWKMKAVAIADFSSLFHLVEFYELAKKQNINPILGCTFQVLDKEKNGKSVVKLFCKTTEGYKNIVKLSSIAQTKEGNEKYITEEEFKKYHKENVVILAGTNQKEKIEFFLEHVTRDDFYMGIYREEGKEKTSWEKMANFYHTRAAVNVVAMQKVLYLKKGDALGHAFLQGNAEVKTEEHYFKSTQEMEKIFFDIPEAIKSTEEIAAKCEVQLPIKGTNAFEKKEISFPIPSAFKGFSTLTRYFKPLPKLNYNLSPEEQRTAEYVTALAVKNFKRLYPETDPEKRRNAFRRLKMELGVIIGKRFCNYFLIVADIIRYAKHHGIGVAPGRGSAAGSLLAYCLGITEICPLEYQLIFERFLDVERLDEPDIDIDFTPEGRVEVVRYLFQRYGKDHAAGIVTFNKYGAKSAVTQVAKIYGMSDAEIRELTKKMGNEETIEKVLDSKYGYIFKKKMQQNPIIKNVFEGAKKIEGFPKNISRHPAGYILSETSIQEEIPVIKTETEDFGEFYVSQISVTDGNVEKMGFTKFDFLVNRSLKTLKSIEKSVENQFGKKIESISLTDPKTYRLYKTGNLLGVFQMDSAGMRKVSKEAQVNCFEDIIALIALYRPGPMDNIPQFIESKQQKKTFSLVGAEDLAPILKNTYGIIVYQEQILEILKQWAKYTYGEADAVRRAISKKKRGFIETERKRFVEKSVKNGREESVSEQIYDWIVKFSDYGFNRAHSAAYAQITYQMSWYKANYPKEFYAVVLSAEFASRRKSAMPNILRANEYVFDAQQAGVLILDPNINMPVYDFVPTSEGIVFGLTAVKGIGKNVSDILLKEVEKSPFISYFDFLRRIPHALVNKKQKEALIHSGFLDQFGERKWMIENLDEKIEKSQMTFDEIPGISSDIKFASYTKEEAQKSEWHLLGMIRDHCAASIQVPNSYVENPQKKEKIRQQIQTWSKQYPGNELVAFRFGQEKIVQNMKINQKLLDEIKKIVIFDYFVHVKKYKMYNVN